MQYDFVRRQMKARPRPGSMNSMAFRVAETLPQSVRPHRGVPPLRMHCARNFSARRGAVANASPGIGVR